MITKRPYTVKFLMYRHFTDALIFMLFCEASEERRPAFGIFYNTDFLQLKRLKYRYFQKKKKKR